MSWSDAKRDAEAIRPLKQDGKRVFLADFKDQAALDLFAPQHRWGISYYRMVYQAALREHKRGGLKITKLMISVEDYLAWLHGRKDTAELRQGFIEARLASKPGIAGGAG